MPVSNSSSTETIEELIHNFQKYNNEVVKYTDEESQYFGDLIIRIEKSRRQRQSSYSELNDMDYQRYYDSNQRAANSYMAPKKNRSDVRVVMGTTEEKENSLLSAVLNYNLEPTIFTYDDFNMEDKELGNVMEKLVAKSRELESWEEKRVLIYKEALDQGNVFVDEQWIEDVKIQKKIKNINWADGVKIKDIKWETKEVIEEGMCQSRLIAGDKVYLGNIREVDIKKQPYIFTKDRISYAEAATIYGNWERFKYVQKRVVYFNNQNDITGYRVWTLEDLENGMVEVVKYQDKYSNEFMLILNGVMMLPIGFPLTAVSPSGEYTMSKGDIFPISQFFAYGKSIPAKSKVDQELLDEMYKLVILKTRKSFNPVLANNTNKVFSEDINIPGNIINGVDPNKLQPIGDSSGVNLAEFNALQFIKSIVDEKTVSPVFTGDVSGKNQTATEIMEMKKQQMMKLGLVILGIINLEKQMAYKRIYNILANWTEPIDRRVNPVTKKIEDVYRMVTIDGQVEENLNGKNIIEFNPNAGNYSPDQIMEEENMLEQKYKMPVRKTYLDPKIKNFRMNWYVNVSASEKYTSELERILFKQDIQDAITLFGPQSLNFDYLRKKFATLSKQDPTKFFVSSVPSFPTQAAMGGGDNGGLGAQLNRGMATAPMVQPQQAPQ